MAGGGDTDQDQKTHDPTDKRLEDARKKGDIAMAPETKHAAMFLAALVVTGGMGVYTVQGLINLLVRLWGGAEDFHLEPEGAQDFATGLLGQLAYGLMPILGMLFAFALLGGLLQGRPTIAWARVKPKWSKLNPFSGLMRMFGKQALVEFAKTLAKTSIVCGMAWYVLSAKAEGIVALVGATPEAIGAAAMDLVNGLLKTIAMLVAALAAFDIFWQRRNFLKKMRMTLQEVKDEHKESEGDPKIKGKIRQLQMQRARSRMMQAVPDASVVIANPTHYAVALKYDHGEMAAPVVVAKGVDSLALKIRSVAEEAGVPVVENIPLARALYASSELDRPIPTQHYAAVAEVISYVMKLAKRRA